MSELSFHFNPGESPAFNEPAIDLGTEISVDGERWPYVLDVEEFFKALTGSGRLPIFTCSCGWFGCGGYYVDVSHTPDEWVWTNRYDPNDAYSLRAEVEACFSGTMSTPFRPRSKPASLAPCPRLFGRTPRSATGAACTNTRGAPDCGNSRCRSA